jgi:hypothetical protein
MRLFDGLLLTLSLIAGSDVLCFDNEKLGTLPPSWTVAMTHTGGAPRWEVIRDDSAPTPPQVLAQLSSDTTAGRFPLAVWNGATLRNGEVKVSFRVISGRVDQAAGLVWRYRDQNNYYIARANALESNVVLYKVENGTRLSIAPKGLPSRSYRVKHEIPRDRWNRLGVVFQDHTFTVFLNNEHLFEAEDETFTNSGKTGLWTKADSVTYFDNFTVSGNEAKQ